LPEDLHREWIGGPRLVGQSTNAVVDVGLENDVLGLCLGIVVSNRLLARALDLCRCSEVRGVIGALLKLHAF